MQDTIQEPSPSARGSRWWNSLSRYTSMLLLDWIVMLAILILVAVVAFRQGSREYQATADSAAKPTLTADLERPIDVNHASQEELQVIPGIGPVLAKRIVDYRHKNGYFRTVQDLVKVKGIGPKLLLRWEGLIVALPDTIEKKGTPIE